MATTTYVAKYGDWLAKIAEAHGTTVSAIWNHPENAAHRQKRGSPDVLYPGDVLRIASADRVASAAPGVSPVEPQVQPTAEWPYPPYEGPFTTGPSWECPGGTCACHPAPEDGPVEEHVIVFYTPQGARMPGARCRVYEAGRLITPDGAAANGAGELRVELRDSSSSIRVEWAPPNLPRHDFLPYHKTYNVKMNDEEGDVGLDRRLSNLGFWRGRRREDNVRDYQRAYSREPTGDPGEIRLEVLDRHDNGAVEVFHPHEPQGDAPVNNPANRSFFGSPQQSSGRLGLTPDGQGGGGGSGGGAGQKNPTGQNVKGSAVPDATDMLLLVALEIDFPVLDPKSVKLSVRPLNVPGMPPDKKDKDVKPVAGGIPVTKRVINGTTIPDHLLYGFKDLPIGTYTASATIESVATVSKLGTTGARGSTEVELKMGLLTIGYVGMKRSPYMVICQNMKSHPPTTDANNYYRQAHQWSEKWAQADPSARGFHAVQPDAETKDSLNDTAIDALASKMREAFKLVCEKAFGGVVYSALGHGGVDWTDADKNALPARRARLQQDKAALKKRRDELRDLRRSEDSSSPAYPKKEIEQTEKEIEEEQARINDEDAKINRTLFPTFSLGAQRGGLHTQYLSMDGEYFIFLDNPNGGYTDKEKKAYKARQRYFAGLKKILQMNKIQKLHLIACDIGKDEAFVTRVANELGVTIVAYKYFTLIKEGTWFIGLSSDHATDNIHKAVGVEVPPEEHATVK